MYIYIIYISVVEVQHCLDTLIKPHIGSSRRFILTSPGNISLSVEYRKVLHPEAGCWRQVYFEKPCREKEGIRWCHILCVLTDGSRIKSVMRHHVCSELIKSSKRVSITVKVATPTGAAFRDILCLLMEEGQLA